MPHRVHIIGRHQPAHQVEHDIAGGRVERPAVHQAVERRALDRAEAGGFRDAAPIGVERLAGARGAILHVAADENGSVHRPRRGAGNGFDLQPGLFEQTVQHAPGERAMGAAALQSQVDQHRLARGFSFRTGLSSHARPNSNKTMTRSDLAYETCAKPSSQARAQAVFTTRRLCAAHQSGITFSQA